jgi:serine/threonine protein kinase
VIATEYTVMTQRCLRWELRRILAVPYSKRGWTNGKGSFAGVVLNGVSAGDALAAHGDRRGGCSMEEPGASTGFDGTQPTADSPKASGSLAGRQARVGVGSRIAGYRIEASLGTGGMSQVFLALDERLARHVALKVLASELAQDDTFRQRFIGESRAAATVDNPHVIPIYEAGEADGLLFIAMRYVRGGDVRRLIKREGSVPPVRAVSIISAVADALDAAHAAGLIHSDVKTGNILLETDPGRPDRVYLADWGLTRWLADPDEFEKSGQFIGTSNYVSPELIRGGPISGKSDQYALACVAFEMLSGSPPFAKDLDAAIIWAHVEEAPPSITSLRPEFPKELDEVLIRALAKSPEQRFPTCEEFADALSSAFGLLSQMNRGQKSAPRRTLTVPLKPSFRYVHEPARAGEDALPSLGNDSLIANLQSRIVHSRGGTFLITGFRGVGKSTLVLRALDEIITKSAIDGELTLPVVVSVARSTTTERLLFAIVRRVFEALSDSGALGKLSPQTRHALLVAYMRTSLSFKETQSEARERSAGLDLSIWARASSEGSGGFRGSQSIDVSKA